MNEQTKKLARQCGLFPLFICVSEPTGSQVIKPIDKKVIAQVADLIRAEEREACAKLCEDNANDSDMSGAYWCADAIRARSDV